MRLDILLQIRACSRSSVSPSAAVVLASWLRIVVLIASFPVSVVCLLVCSFVRWLKFVNPVGHGFLVWIERLGEVLDLLLDHLGMRLALGVG